MAIGHHPSTWMPEGHLSFMLGKEGKGGVCSALRSLVEVSFRLRAITDTQRFRLAASRALNTWQKRQIYRARRISGNKGTIHKIKHTVNVEKVVSVKYIKIQRELLKESLVDLKISQTKLDLFKRRIHWFKMQIN
jgi:hypothetical protein